MAFEAVAHRRGMNLAMDLGGVFVGMTCDTKRLWSGSGQLYPCDVSIDSDLVASGAPHRNRRVNYFALGFVFMALDALG